MRHGGPAPRWACCSPLTGPGGPWAGPTTVSQHEVECAGRAQHRPPMVRIQRLISGHTRTSHILATPTTPPRHDSLLAGPSGGSQHV